MAPRGRPPQRDPNAPLGGQRISRAKQPAKYPERVVPAPKATASRDTGFSSATKALIDARDKGMCVRCGAPATNRDHRRGRGAGGQSKAEQRRTDTPAWGATLCGFGNTSGCHGWKESNGQRAEDDGYRIRRNGNDLDAATVPIYTRFGWMLFLDDGTMQGVDAPEIIE